MGELSTRTRNTRVYERVTTEHTESVFVHLTDDGYVRMTAKNLHDVLTHLGFLPTDTKD